MLGQMLFAPSETRMTIMGTFDPSMSDQCVDKKKMAMSFPLSLFSIITHCDREMLNVVHHSTGNVWGSTSLSCQSQRIAFGIHFFCLTLPPSLCLHWCQNLQVMIPVLKRHFRKHCTLTKCNCSSPILCTSPSTTLGRFVFIPSTADMN